MKHDLVTLLIVIGLCAGVALFAFLVSAAAL